MDASLHFSELATFLTTHWALSTALAAVLVLALANELVNLRFGLPSIEPQELVAMLNHKGAAVVDIRTRGLYDQGHINGAISLPQAEINDKLTALNKYKNKPVILVCASGLQASKIGVALRAQGVTQLYYLAGGMGAWQSQGMPSVKK